jgi:carbamoyl-phosphate synthase large subunit
LREVFEEYEIQAVINLARSRGRDTVDEDYVARRNAVDFGIVVSTTVAVAMPLSADPT